jgi:hypothetical protein
MDSYDHRNGSGIYIQIGAGAGDLDERAQCRDGFTEFIKRLPREHVRKIILVITGAGYLKRHNKGKTRPLPGWGVSFSYCDAAFPWAAGFLSSSWELV